MRAALRARSFSKTGSRRLARIVMATETRLPRRGSARSDAPRDGENASDDLVELCEHLLLANPQHVPTQRAERAVPRGIMPGPLCVVAPVHLHDKAHLGACKVDDVLPDDELAPKRKPS